jgi:hypothetical protein
MPAQRITDYRLKGDEPTTVWSLPLDEIDAVLGTDTRKDRTDRLRALRDLGLLVHSPGRLTGKVRDRPAVAGDSGVRRAYLFTVPPEELPRRRARRPRQGVTTW